MLTLLARGPAGAWAHTAGPPALTPVPARCMCLLLSSKWMPVLCGSVWGVGKQTFLLWMGDAPGRGMVVQTVTSIVRGSLSDRSFTVLCFRCPL